jgi:phosphinothricin acetyltransferase
MEPPIIELARRDDVRRALELANWAAEHTVANFATVPEELAPWLAEFDRRHATHPWLVARALETGGVVGFAKASPYRLRAAYDWTAEVTVYVDPACHAQGVGRRLYELLFPLLREQGYVTLLAGITTPHPASERLHERFGFRRCATLHRVGWKFGAWRDVGFWELSLSPEETAPSRVRRVEEAWATLGAHAS